MKRLFDFNDYLFDIIFESKSEITVTLSDRLYDLLLSIEEHPVANELLSINEKDFKSSKVAYIDYDDENIENFTYIIPSKVKDAIKIRRDNLTDKNIETMFNLGRHDIYRLGTKDYYPEVWSKFRNSTSISRVVNKLFPGKFEASGKPGEDLESFKSLVISERKKEKDVFKRFDVVDGKDINKYYLEENYDTSAASTLAKSCMRYERCEPFMDFYADNKGVKMVVLYSETDPDKISGRALLWDIEYINDEKVDRKFMDRIYATDDSEVILFKQYAKKNGWLHKSTQDMHADTAIVDDGEIDDMVLKTTQTFKTAKYYPYMDTMKYFYFDEGDNFLSNSNKYGKNYLYLEETDGTYAGQRSDYDDYDQDYYDEHMIYVEHYGRAFYEEDVIFCELGDEFRTVRDAVWLQEFQTYATNEYIENELTFSEPLNHYIYNDIAVESRYYDGEYIPTDESSLVYELGAASLDFDEIYNNDAYRDYMLDVDIERYDHILYYFEPHMYFHYDDREYFVLSKRLSNNEYVWAHKDWDKEDLFKINNDLYLNDIGDPIKTKEYIDKIKK